MDSPINEILDRKGTDVFAVSPETSVIAAVRLMNEKNVGAVVVLQQGRLVGIFTERDVLRRVVDGGRAAADTPVADVMTREMVYIRPSTTVGEALMVVNAKGCRHLPVIQDEQVVGMVSVRDLIRQVVDGQEHRIEELMQYISGNYGPAVQVGPRGELEGVGI